MIGERKAQALDAHRAAGSEVQQPSDQLRRTIGRDASRYRFAFRARDPAAAHRTTGRQAKLSFLAGAFRFDDFQDFRNNVAAAFNQNPVTDTQAEPLDLVFVVQGRARNSDAAELYRLQHRHRCQRARAADLHNDIVDPGRRLARRILVSDRPARRFSGRAKLVLQGG